MTWLDDLRRQLPDIAAVDPHAAKMAGHVLNGTFERHIWQHPEDLIATMRNMVEDASNGDANSLAALTGSFTLTNKPTSRRAWRNWKLDSVDPSYRQTVVALLHPAAAILSQTDFDYLVGADLAAAFGVARGSETAYTSLVEDTATSMTLEEFGAHARSLFGVDADNRRLAEAFAAQMMAEAEPHRQRIILGSYEMDRVPLQYIDSLIRYRTIRLVITPDGIAASLISNHFDEHMYSPFWWSPQYHTLWSLGGRKAFALSVLMACIWRDACIVRERVFTPSAGTGVHRIRHPRGQAKLRLPRTAHTVAWSSQAERDEIIRARHSVRAFYRALPEGWQRSEDAILAAAEYGYPAPPVGYTFVRPHQRGHGDNVEPQSVQIVCTGLQTAAIALNWSAS